MANRPTIREVVAVAEFRALWIAHAQSRLGDQLARVAIAVLVFDRTASALLTAVTYALSFLPPLVSAPLLTGLADRFPRRTVMVVTELVRAALTATMAIPGLPIAVLIVLLVAVVSLQPLYSAARNALLPDVLEGDRFVVGVGLASATDSVVQVLGFAVGGLLVSLTGSHVALGINAATFLVSSTMIRTGLRHRDVPAGARRTVGRSVSAGVRLIWTDRRLRSLLGLLYLYGFYLAPEGLAAPYAAQAGGGDAAVGLLMAADPVGAMIGSVLLSRWLPARWRSRSLGPLAVASAVPLAVSAVLPSVPGAVGLWVLVGVLSSYTMLAHATFVRLVPNDQRGQVVGLASAGLQAAQGLGVAAAGVLADLTSPATAIALMGATGGALAILAGHSWSRTQRHADAKEPNQSPPTHS
ncbi:MFS transporter [Kribbella sp. HUAS MG21]|uniref:MFS transporter n=1 Tax=Kribbella sp. HUAS MG21 TaxID=3160966 RepID=A0AAU7T7G0_9ACTN